MEKNMDAVKKFKNVESLKFLRGMCFNNAAVIVAGLTRKENIDNNEQIARLVFSMARLLFNEAIKVKFNEWEDAI